MHRGFIKLWRNITESPVWANPDLLKVYLWCQVKATHKPFDAVMCAGNAVFTVPLQPGQFVTGRHQAAEALGMHPSSVRDRLKKLGKLGIIDIRPDKHFSIITIINWETYQHQHTEDRQQDRQRDDKEATSVRQGHDTYKNIKNIQNNKEYREEKKAPERRGNSETVGDTRAQASPLPISSMTAFDGWATLRLYLHKDNKQRYKEPIPDPWILAVCRKVEKDWYTFVRCFEGDRCDSFDMKCKRQDRLKWEFKDAWQVLEHERKTNGGSGLTH